MRKTDTSIEHKSPLTILESNSLNVTCAQSRDNDIIKIEKVMQQLVQKVTGKMMEVVENKATPLMIDR